MTLQGSRQKLAELRAAAYKQMYDDYKKLENEKYPNGRFIIARRQRYGEDVITLTNERFCGINGNPEFKHEYGVIQDGYVCTVLQRGKANHCYNLRRNHSKCTYYTSLEKMVEAAKRFKISQILIEMFITEHNAMQPFKGEINLEI